jgi:hypothetical protein
MSRAQGAGNAMADRAGLAIGTATTDADAQIKLGRVLGQTRGCMTSNRCPSTTK